MRKGEIAITTFFAIGLGIAVLALLLWPLIGQSNIFGQVINACEQRGGQCVQVCTGEGARVLNEGAGECKQQGPEFVCCTSPEIKERLEDNQLPPLSPKVKIKSPQLDKSYTNSEKIPVMVGRKYDFGVITDNLDADECRMWLIDEETDLKLSAGLKDGADVSGDCDDLKLTGLNFDGYNLDMDLVLRLEATKDKETVAKARYPLDLQDAFSVKQYTIDWTNEQDLSITCNLGGCKEANMWLRNNAACKEDAGSMTLTASFADGTTQITVDESNIEELTPNQEGFESAVCMQVTLEGGQKLVRTLPTALRMDVLPPNMEAELTSSGLEIKCTDSLSGCDEYHYQLFNVKVNTDLDSMTADEVVNQIMAWTNEVTVCPTEGYSRGGFSGDRTLVDLPQMDYGTLCVYAVDEAGNGGPEHADIEAYTDLWSLGSDILGPINTWFS